MQAKWGIRHYTQLFENDKISWNSEFLNLQKKLNKLLESLELEDKHIILAVSWWADSMLVASQVLYYYHINKLNFNNIHIAHCNHKIRKESENEAEFISDFFSGLDFHLYERDKSLSEDENSLRNRRYSQFSLLQKSTKSSYVFVGHHLNDRVESTLLNLMRGSWINGFLNMHKVEEHHLLPENSKVCRPLLETSKSEILNICDEIGLPYFEDRTNKDISISKRNRVRNQILNPLSTYWNNWEENKFLESFSGIYKQLENIEDYNLGSDLKSIPNFPLWNTEFSYLWEKDILKCDENDVFDLFHTLMIQASATVINEWKIRLNNWKNGYKYIWWIYFFIHENHLFILKAKRDFWKRKNNSEENITLWITTMEDIKFFWFDLRIPRDELVWWQVRLPQTGDIFAWKKRGRRALNQKIPMRRRDWIPLAIKDGKVIHMWKNVWK